jgi:FG-GAP repeat
MRKRCISVCWLFAILVLATGAQAQDTRAETGDRFGNAVAHGDFNGDGCQDLAIGVSFEDIRNVPAPSIANAGAVEVIYGTLSGLAATNRQFWQQGSAGLNDAAEADDAFGQSLVTGDFNKDGYDDLAIGVPYEDVGDVVDAGAVHVVYGSRTGLSTTSVPDQFWHQDRAGIPELAEYLDSFGYRLASADFNADGFDDLAISSSEESGTGAVHIIHGSATGLSAYAVPAQLWRQGATGLGDVPEHYDWFGVSLAAVDFNDDGYADLAIGASGENTSRGIVQVLHGSRIGLSATIIPDQVWAQGSGGVPGMGETSDSFGRSLAAGDFNNDRYGDLAIGVPGEDVDGMPAAGEVIVLYGSAFGLSTTAVRPAQLWRQGVAFGVLDAAEPGDYFGWALTTGDFNGDGFGDLAIAADREDLGAVLDAGAVNVLHGSARGLSSTYDQFWHQNSNGIEGAAGSADLFGRFLTAGDFDHNGADDLAVGVPHEDWTSASGILVDAGGVNVIYGSVFGLTAVGDQMWTQTLILPPQP